MTGSRHRNLRRAAPIAVRVIPHEVARVSYRQPPPLPASSPTGRKRRGTVNHAARAMAGARASRLPRHAHQRARCPRSDTSQTVRKRPATAPRGAVWCDTKEGDYPWSPTHSESRRLAARKPAALVGRCPARPLSGESGTVASSGEQRLQERSNVLLADGLLRDRAHPHIADVFTRAGAAQHPLRGLAIGCLHGAACLPGREI